MLKKTTQRALSTASNKTVLSLADQVVVSGTRFATTVMVGRLGSDSELGTYSLAFSLVILAVSFQESLISIPYTVFVKRLKRPHQRRYSASSLAQSILLNLVAVGVLAAGCLGLLVAGDSAGLLGPLAVLVVVTPFLLLREFARRYAFAHLRVRVALALDLLVSAVQLGGLGCVAYLGSVSAFWAYVVSGIAAVIGSLAWLWSSTAEFRWERGRMAEDWGRNWGFGKWVAGAHLVSVLHMYLAHWMLAAMIDQSATGIFTACLTVLVLANPFILGMSNVLSPKAAHVFAEDGLAATRQLVIRYALLIASVLLAFTVVAASGGNAFIVWAFQERYAGNDSSILVLAVGTIALGISFAAASGLRAIDRPEVNFWAGIVGLLTTAALSALLIGHLGVLGASIGLVAGFYAMAIHRGASFLMLTGQHRSVGASSA